MKETNPKKQLSIDVFFQKVDGKTRLTSEGSQGIEALFEEFQGEKVRELSGVTRSAIYNYTKPEVNISSKGRKAIETLVKIYNGEAPASDKQDNVSSDGLAQYSEKELMLELKRRGFKVTLEV